MFRSNHLTHQRSDVLLTIRARIGASATDMIHRDLPYLQHVLDACADIGEFVVDGREAVEKSKLVLNGVVRQLSVIGEAVKRISPETKALAPIVPWKQIAGMRVRLVHEVP